MRVYVFRRRGVLVTHAHGLLPLTSLDMHLCLLMPLCAVAPWRSRVASQEGAGAVMSDRVTWLLGMARGGAKLATTKSKNKGTHTHTHTTISTYISTAQEQRYTHTTMSTALRGASAEVVSLR